MNFEHWVRTAKLFIVDHYEESALTPGGSIEGAMATATSLPWREATLFRVGSIIQEHEAVRSKSMLPPDTDRIRAALAGRDRCASGFFASMDASKGMLAGAEGRGMPEEAAARYTYVQGCPAYGTSDEPAFIPQAWAESPYVPPHKMEHLKDFGFSAMPLEAVAGNFSESEICASVPSFCAYNNITIDAFDPFPPSAYRDAPFVNVDADGLEATLEASSHHATNAAVFATGILVGALLAVLTFGGGTGTNASTKLKAN